MPSVPVWLVLVRAPFWWLSSLLAVSWCEVGRGGSEGVSSVLSDQGPTWDFTCHLHEGPISKDTHAGALTPAFPVPCLPPLSASLSASTPGASPSVPSQVLPGAWSVTATRFSALQRKLLKVSEERSPSQAFDGSRGGASDVSSGLEWGGTGTLSPARWRGVQLGPGGRLRFWHSAGWSRQPGAQPTDAARRGL